MKCPSFMMQCHCDTNFSHSAKNSSSPKCIMNFLRDLCIISLCTLSTYCKTPIIKILLHAKYILKEQVTVASYNYAFFFCRDKICINAAATLNDISKACAWAQCQAEARGFINTHLILPQVQNDMQSLDGM